MARIVYALSGQGRGHSSRVTAIAGALSARGHTLVLVAGGSAAELGPQLGIEVIDVPVLHQLVHNNRVLLTRSLWSNRSNFLGLPSTIDRLATAFDDFRPDLVITDFEAHSWRAARKRGIPVLSFNHQQVVSHTRYHLPLRYRADAWVARRVVDFIAPANPTHVLVTSFFFPEVIDPRLTTLVPPILRPEIRAAKPTLGEHVLVYHNHPEGSDALLHTLAAVDAHFIVYGFAPESKSPSENVELRSASTDGFVSDLAAARAVISTAGYTLMSEALALGKPMFVMPNVGIFEQALNALFLESDGLGEAIYGDGPTSAELMAFLARAPRYAERIAGRIGCGNDAALDCIEGILKRLGVPA